jgi:hypothetical protein
MNDMVEKTFTSLLSNFRQKSTNPILGTLLIVWVFSNWKLVYPLFNFDKDADLVYKITTIRAYYLKVNFYENLGWCALKAIGILILTYALMNLGRFVVEFYEKMVTPYIYKLFGNTKIVSRERFDALKSENKKLELMLEEENERRIKEQAKVERLEKKLGESNNLDVTSEKVPLIKKSTNKKVSIVKNEGTDVDSLLKAVSAQKMVREYANFIKEVEAGKPISSGSNVASNALSLSLVKIKSDRNGFLQYDFSPLGKEFVKKFKEVYLAT